MATNEKPARPSCVKSEGDQFTTIDQGHDGVLRTNPTIASLDRVRVDASDQPLTTNQADHERIPERMAYARGGSGAHGDFEACDALIQYMQAAPFAEQCEITPVFVRFNRITVCPTLRGVRA